MTLLKKTAWGLVALIGIANAGALIGHTIHGFRQAVDPKQVLYPPVGEYLQAHGQLGDGFSVEVYGTVGDKCKAALEATGLPVKIFESKCGYSRV